MTPRFLPRTAGLLAMLGTLSCQRQPEPAPTPDALPIDVSSFMARREGCDALLRYRPADDEDMHEIKTQRYDMCHGIDRELAEVRSDHSTDQRIVRLLARYGPVRFEAD